MDFSVKRHDTDGMFNSPPGLPSVNPTARTSGQGLSKLDLFLSRPGVLRHNGGGLVPSPESNFQGPSQQTTISQALPLSNRSSPQNSQTPHTSGQRSPVIVNNRERAFQTTHRDEAPARFSSGISSNGSGTTGRAMLSGAPLRFLQSQQASSSSNGMRSANAIGQRSSVLRSPPSYDSLRYLQGSPQHGGSQVGQRLSLRPSAPTRPLRFAPMMKPPPLLARTEASRQRHYVIHSNPASVASLSSRVGTHDPDTLAKISELAKITRASIPMSPLEDESDTASPGASRKEHNNSFRELMPPPPPATTRVAVRTPSPSGRLAVNSSNIMSSEAMSSVASQLGIQVEVVHKLTPVPSTNATLRSRFPALQDTNLGFSNFASAMAFLTLDEPPLNPLEIESSKDVLISIFGPKMTLYRCGGCESTFVFRSVFSDHLYRGIVPYRLRCSHCKDTLAFTNVCQVKEHVRSHGFPNLQTAKGFVLTVAEVNDENIQPGESMGAKLAAQQLSKSANAERPQISVVKSTGLPVAVAGTWTTSKPPSSSNKMLQEMLKRTDSSDVPSVAPPGVRQQPEGPTSFRSLQSSSSTPNRNSAAHALQRLRLQAEVQETLKTQSEVAKPTAAVGRPTISVGQILLREIIRNPSTSTSTAVESFEASRGAAPRTVCMYCRSAFDGQTGITHHFQRFKDVTEAAANFRCKECSVVCCNQCSFDAHQRIHRLNRSSPNMGDICCPECGLKLESLEEVVSHVERRCVHWCRMLCCSYNCCMQNCRYCSTNEADYFAHMVNEHSGQPDGKNVCPVCRVQINGPRAILMDHLSSASSCRQRVLQQKSVFFAYHCVYCEDNNGPVFETKAAMRDHIAHVHAAGLPKSAAWTSNSSVVHAKRISSFSEFENTFKRPTFANTSGGVVNSLLARRSAESALVAPPLQDGNQTNPSKASSARADLLRNDRLVSQVPAASTNSSITQNLTLLKRTLTEEEAKSQMSKKSRATFGCQLCAFEGHFHEELVAHMEHQHTRETAKSASPGPPLRKSASRYDCKVCEMERRSFSCDVEKVFHDHVRREHPAKDSSFQCSECALQLLSLSVLQMHMRVHHDIADANSFLSSCSFYTGMRMFRPNGPSASPASIQPTFDQQPRSSSLKLRIVQSTSGLFQHSSSSPNDQSGSSSHN